SSVAAERAGLKIHVVKAGEMKGIGESGTAITDEQLTELQRIVDDVNSFFVTSAAKGRAMPLETMRKLADGRVHVAADAQRLGLIDGVATFAETLAELQRQGEQGRAVTPPLRPTPA